MLFSLALEAWTVNSCSTNISQFCSIYHIIPKVTSDIQEESAFEFDACEGFDRKRKDFDKIANPQSGSLNRNGLDDPTRFGPFALIKIGCALVSGASVG